MRFRITRTARLGPALALGAVLSAGGASAQGPGAGPCQADAERLCKGVAPGGGALARCLKEHESELSKECSDQITKRGQDIRKRMGTIEEACQADIAKHCAGIEHGQGRVARCLKDHEAELTPDCRAAFDARGR